MYRSLIISIIRQHGRPRAAVVVLIIINTSYHNRASTIIHLTYIDIYNNKPIICNRAEHYYSAVVHEAHII